MRSGTLIHHGKGIHVHDHTLMGQLLLAVFRAGMGVVIDNETRWFCGVEGLDKKYHTGHTGSRIPRGADYYFRRK